MSKLGTNKIEPWQWPNVLSLDAAIIAPLWYFLFARSINAQASPWAALVLALSVWLTYEADRLFDVSKRPTTQLLSTRHQFTQKHAPALWRLWWGTLSLNIGIAVYTLQPRQLFNGLILLGICLLYTLLNQALSKRFFPKQLCVALIYTGGVIVFLPMHQLWASSLSFCCLCLLNCRLISRKEVEVDRAMGERTLLLNGHFPNLALVGVIAYTAIHSPDTATLAILLSAVSYQVLGLIQNKFPVEMYRVLIDGTLCITPLSIFFVQLLNE